MAKSVLHTIEDNLSTFSKGQKRIGRYILDHYDQAAFMTASKLGKLTEVSESTVVRFAAELGFDGYPAMQKALQEMARNRLTSTQRIQAAENIYDRDVLSSVLQADIENLRQISMDEDRDTFQTAVEKIVHARHIYILGARSSTHLAGYLYFYMQMIFENVTLVLSASAHMRHFTKKRYRLEIDLKPALDEQQLDKRLLADFAKYANHDFQNSLDDLLPQKLIPVVVELSGIPGRQKVHDLTREQRQSLLRVLKHFPVEVSGPCPVEDAIVTSGGVKVGEVDPKTMESKLVKNLYFAGELLDTDAYTGGFNLQIAWATGRLAGQSAANEKE